MHFEATSDDFFVDHDFFCEKNYVKNLEKSFLFKTKKVVH